MDYSVKHGSILAKLGIAHIENIVPLVTLINKLNVLLSFQNFKSVDNYIF